jgi:hypothetical protein
MEPTRKSKFDISTILLNLLGIAFLSYVIYMLRGIGAHLRVIAVFALMMPMFISILRACRKMDKTTDLERWIFALIALALWLIQSLLTGKLGRLFH